MARQRNVMGQRAEAAVGSVPGALPLDGKMAAAPSTFRTKRDAEAYLSTVRADMERGRWVNPVAGRVTLRDYATRWLRAPGPATAHGRALRERAAAPHPPGARRARAGQHLRRPRCGSGTRRCSRPTSPAPHGRQVLPAAARHPEHRGGRRADLRNPCVIKGAGQEKTPERPIGLDPPGLRDRRHDRAEVPGHGARRRVRRAAPRRDARPHPRAGRPAARPRSRWSSSTSSSRTAPTSSARRSPMPASAPSPSRRCSSPSWSRTSPSYAAPGKKGLVFCGPEGPAAAAGELVHRRGAGRRRAGHRGHEAPRPPPHRQHAGGDDRGEHEGADGKVRPVDLTGGPDLPARHPGPRPRDRRRPQRHDRGHTTDPAHSAEGPNSGRRTSGSVRRARGACPTGVQTAVGLAGPRHRGSTRIQQQCGVRPTCRSERSHPWRSSASSHPRDRKRRARRTGRAPLLRARPAGFHPR